MKKILLLSAITLIGLTSCKKEESVSTDLDAQLKPVYIQLNVDNYTGNYIVVY